MSLWLRWANKHMKRQTLPVGFCWGPSTFLHQFDWVGLKWVKWAATWQNQQNECAPSEDSDQPEHPPSLIRVFAVRMKKPWVLSYSLRAQWRLWSDWADAQADLSLRWVHTHFVGFVMSRLKFNSKFIFKLEESGLPNENEAVQPL